MDELTAAINSAAGNLPDDWIIHVCAELGAGWVELYTDFGEQVEFPTSPDKSLAQQVDDAIDYARAALQLPPVGTSVTDHE